MRKLVAGVIAALIAGPLVFTGTASADGPTFFCWEKDEGPGSEDPESDDYAEVPGDYPTKSAAKKAGFIRCFAQGPQGADSPAQARGPGPQPTRHPIPRDSPTGPRAKPARGPYRVTPPLTVSGQIENSLERVSKAPAGNGGFRNVDLQAKSPARTEHVR